MRKDTAAQASRGVRVERLPTSQVGGRTTTRNRRNGKKKKRHMQKKKKKSTVTKQTITCKPRKGPGKLAGKKPKIICQGGRSPPVEVVLPMSGGALTPLRGTVRKPLLSVLKTVGAGERSELKTGAPGRRRACGGMTEVGQFTGCRGPRGNFRPRRCAGRCAPAGPSGRRSARRTTRT